MNSRINFSITEIFSIVIASVFLGGSAGVLLSVLSPLYYSTSFGLLVGGIGVGALVWFWFIPKEEELKVVPAGREETMKIVEGLKSKNPETKKLFEK